MRNLNDIFLLEKVLHVNQNVSDNLAIVSFINNSKNIRYDLDKPINSDQYGAEQVYNLRKRPWEWMGFSMLISIEFSLYRFDGCRQLRVSACPLDRSADGRTVYIKPAGHFITLRCQDNGT
jgi:hypothetical protein